MENANIAFPMKRTLATLRKQEIWKTGINNNQVWLYKNNPCGAAMLDFHFHFPVSLFPCLSLVRINTNLGKRFFKKYILASCWDEMLMYQIMMRHRLMCFEERYNLAVILCVAWCWTLYYGGERGRWKLKNIWLNQCNGCSSSSFVCE